MVQHIEDELSRVYPEIHFVVKDTSEGGMKKIVITRLNNEADSESLLESYMIKKILIYL